VAEAQTTCPQGIRAAVEAEAVEEEEEEGVAEVAVVRSAR